MILSDKILSIVIPIYNVENVLPKALSSIVENCDSTDLQKLDIILVDDVSPDNSITIAKKFEKEYPNIVQIIRHKKNLGLGGARNSGIDVAKGKFIIFLDSDDWLSSQAIKFLLNSLENGQNNEIYIFGLNAIRDNNIIWKYLPAKNEVIGFSEALDLISRDKMIPSACNKAFPAKLFDNLRFKENLYYEDLELCPQLINQADLVIFLDKALYNYRLEGESITRQTLKVKHIEDLSIVINSLRLKLSNNNFVVSNFFFGRWTYLMKRYSLDTQMFSLALEKIFQFLNQYTIEMCDTNIKASFIEQLKTYNKRLYSDELNDKTLGIIKKIQP